MGMAEKQIIPLGKVFGLLMKQYLSTFDKKLKELPIERYFYAFWVIHNNDGQITSKQLSEILHTNKTIVVRIIDYLTAKDFIERLPNPRDKRSFLLHVTKNGRQYIPAIEKAMKETDEVFIDLISPQNKKVVLNEIISMANSPEHVENDAIHIEFKRINK
jgi:DNA-binding MarR family transcriptional regulator